LNRD